MFLNVTVIPVYPQDSENPSEYLNQALLSFEKGDYAGAEALIRAAIKLDKSLPQAYVQLSLVQEALGKPNRALRLLGRLLNRCLQSKGSGNRPSVSLFESGEATQRDVVPIIMPRSLVMPTRSQIAGEMRSKCIARG